MCMVLVSRLETDGGVGGRWGLPTFQGKKSQGAGTQRSKVTVR